MIYKLIWHSKYGIEEVDSFDTRAEAQRMRTEYKMAFGTGHITIKRVRR